MMPRVVSGKRLDAPHARGNRAFTGDGNQANIAGAIYMRAAAEFDRPAEGVAYALAHDDNSNFVSVFLTKQRACACFASIVHGHQTCVDGIVFENDVVGDVLNAAQLIRRDRLLMHEVEA